MKEKGKVLIWTQRKDITERFKKEIKNFIFIKASYNAELLALAGGKDIFLILVEVDPSNLTSGIKIIRDIRTLAKEVPIVVFAKQLSTLLIHEIIPLNVYDYLVTPFSINEIKRILNDLESGEKGKENYALLYNLSEKLQQLSIENEIIRLLNTTWELDTILDIIIKKALELVNVEASSILLFNENRDSIIFNAVYGEKSDMLKGMELKLDQGIAGWVAKEGKPAIVNDITKDKRYYIGIDKITQFHTRSILCTPIMTEDRIHGVIELVNKKRGEFSNDDLDKIMTLASFAAFALHKSSLIKTERKRVEEITLLFELGTYLSGMLNLEALLQKSAHLIRNSFGFYYIGISLINPEEVVLELKSFDSKEKVEPKRKKVTFDQGLMGWVVRHGTPLRVGDVTKDNRYLKGIESVRSEMVIPLKRKDTILGVIDIGSKKCDSFNDDDQMLTEQIARLLSISIENAMLYKKVGRLAIIDDLTALFNARYCHITLERLRKEKQETFSVIFLDLDFFKLVNDRFGHQIGGKLLREIGEIVKRVAGRNGITIRYGGDEYVVILSRIDKEVTSRTAMNILNLINTTVFLKDEGINYHITASLGVASSPEHATNGEEVLQLADRAMYWVKNHGRNGIKIYDSDVVEISDYPLPGKRM